MTEHHWNNFVLGLGFFIGGLVSLLTDGFSWTFSWFTIMGFAGIVIGGMPIWRKIFGFKEEDE